jgi:hypothetical protein
MVGKGVNRIGMHENMLIRLAHSIKSIGNDGWPSAVMI